MVLKKGFPILFILIFTTCRSTMESGPFQVRVAQINSGQTTGLTLAPETARCENFIQKKIVYGLFVLPINGLSKEESDSLQQAGTIRVKEVMTPGDIGLTFLGFLLSFITKTRIYEKCDGNSITTNTNEKENRDRLIKKYEELEKKYHELLAASENRGSNHSLPVVSFPDFPTDSSIRYELSFLPGLSELTPESGERFKKIFLTQGEALLHKDFLLLGFCAKNNIPKTDRCLKNVNVLKKYLVLRGLDQRRIRIAILGIGQTDDTVGDRFILSIFEAD